MNATNSKGWSTARGLIVTSAVVALLAACASVPTKPAGAAEARARLTQLQTDPNLGSRAPVAMKEADAAVSYAEQPQPDRDLAAHAVFMANTKVDIAKAQAETRFAEDQRTTLAEQREKARLDARTREADIAQGKVAMAQSESAERKLEADQARGAAVVANAAAAAADQARGEAVAANAAAAANNAAAAANAAEQSAELQRQIDALQAKVTDRGIVLTLGDVLFTTGQADLKSSASGNLNKLVTFLNQYPNRTVMIEGFTDNVGTDDYNLALSQRRADSVRSHLVRQGIDAGRLTASGKGESEPIEGNDTAMGRQQNRRVAVIINNPTIAAR
jgi:outer membrane protein OmpA-like peptidoglycan-associated protein